jgi:hypothetical protein
MAAPAQRLEWRMKPQKIMGRRVEEWELSGYAIGCVF